MNRANLFLILGLAGGVVIGLAASGSLGGFGSGVTSGSEMAGMDHSGHSMEGMDHDHSQTRSSDDLPPSAMVHLMPEGGCAFNIHIMAENFVFSPQNVNGDHVPGEGHAHIYIDGKKLSRVYSEWFHFTAPVGAKQVEVTLNANDHATLTVGGTPVTATAQLPDC